MYVLLADDQTRVRFALRVLLEQQVGLQVMGEAADASELLALAHKTCPDLVLLAWGLPGLPMNELLSALHLTCPHALAVALSERQEFRQEALDAGADAFVSKINPPERLLAVIEDCWRKWRIGHPGVGPQGFQGQHQVSPASSGA